MIKYAFVGAAILAIVLACTGIFLAQRAPKSDEAAVKLSMAVHQAQRLLPEFRKRVESPQSTDRAFFIRAQMVDKTGKAEYLWLNQVRVTAKGYSGVIDEPPSLRKDLHRGDRVDVLDEDVVDWTILHVDKTLEGAFTQGQEIQGQEMQGQEMRH